MGAVKRGAVVRCLLAATLFGTSAPAVSTLAGDVNAFALAGLLYVGAGLAVLPSTLLNPPRRRPLRRATPRLAGAVLAGGVIAPVLLAAGLARTPAATASLLLNLELVATVMLAGLVFHEYIGRQVALGTSLVVTAGCILTWSSAPQFRVGAILIVGACLCWAIDNCLTAGLDQLAPHHITLAKGVVAGSANLVVGSALAGWPTVGQILAALLIGLLGYGLSITLWIEGAREVGAARGQLIFAIGPFVGAVIAWIVLGEPVLSSQLLALGLAFIGVSAVLRSAHAHEHRHTVRVHEHDHVHDDLHHDHPHADDVGRHAHSHDHRELVHAHPHVPDLHHWHEHR
jgi:drug/metabolite transporter (DMT)-like permease